MTAEMTGTKIMERVSRRAGLDLLKCVLMLLVCATHYVVTSGILPPFYGGTGLLAEGTYVHPFVRIMGLIVEAVAVTAPNTFVVLNGYLMQGSTWKKRRFLELFAMLLFYAYLVLAAVTLVTGNGPSTAYETVQMLFPLNAQYYWFMTAFLLLYLLSPLLTRGVDALDFETLKFILAALLVLLSLVKSVVPVFFVTDDRGYSTLWLIVLFLTGAVLRKYEDRLRMTALKGGVMVLIGAGTVFLISVYFWVTGATPDTAPRMTQMLSDFNFIFHYITAAGLFCLFKELRIKENGVVARVASALAPYTLGVYLLHAHPSLFYRWLALLTRVTGHVPAGSPLLFPGHFLLCIAIVFACGIVADIIRDRIFRLFSARPGRDAG